MAAQEPQIVTIESDSDEPTIPNGYGSQQPIVPPSPKDFKFPPNPFNVLNSMTVIPRNKDYNLQSPEPSNPSPISTPPMNLITIEGWETPHTAIDDTTFFFKDEPRKVYWDIFSSDTFDSNEPRPISFLSGLTSTPPPPRWWKMKLSMGMSFVQNGECRNTTERHVASPYHYKRHPNAQNKLKTLLLLKFYIYFLTMAHRNGYESNTYP